MFVLEKNTTEIYGHPRDINERPTDMYKIGVTTIDTYERVYVGGENSYGHQHTTKYTYRCIR